MVSNLSYMQIRPLDSLSGIVKHYLVLESNETVRVNYRLFSDGNPGLVFHFKDPLIQYAADRNTASIQPHSFIYGQITHYNDLISSGRLGMLVVVLQPYGIHSLLNIPANQLNNCVIKLSDFFGQEASDLEDQILHMHKAGQIIQCVEQFLFKRLASIKEPDLIFRECLDLIYEYRGVIAIEELLKKIPVTERQLERKFKEQIGTTPKKFSDIVKFQNFLKRLKNHPSGQKISDVIYDGGYYDQSHLNGYFKKTAGLTPTQYKLNHHQLAVNFMQLSSIE